MLFVMRINCSLSSKQNKAKGKAMRKVSTIFVKYRFLLTNLKKIMKIRTWELFKKLYNDLAVVQLLINFYLLSEMSHK